jgi:predicted ATPase
VDPSKRESIEEIRQTWLAESDEALFEALTAGRAQYTEAALRVIAEEAARRGLTRPERMKQLAQAVKAAAVAATESEESAGLQWLLTQVAGILLALAMLAGMIYLRVLIHRW